MSSEVASAKPLCWILPNVDLKPLECENAREALASEREQVDGIMMRTYVQLVLLLRYLRCEM